MEKKEDKKDNTEIKKDEKKEEEVKEEKFDPFLGKKPFTISSII